MFGYIRPVRDDLSEEAYERFRSVYCGLCHRLQERTGLLSRFTVNYDFTFLAMLLTSPGEGSGQCLRCPVHPFEKRLCRRESPALDRAADLSVVLACLKLRDDVRDEGGLSALRARFRLLLLRGAFRKASRRESAFTQAASEQLARLTALEQAESPSLDETADCFALLLAAAAEGEPDETRRRVFRHLFYHIGRLIYLLDALDDLPKDLEKGRYNPLRFRFSLEGAVLPQQALADLDLTLRHSINLIASDFQLLEETEMTDILTDIIYNGIPSAASWLLRKRMPESNTGEEL